MSQEDTMRLVAELLDKTSGPLKEIQKSLKDTRDIAKSMHVQGASHAREHSKAYHELREQIAKIKETAIEVVSPSMAALGLTAFSVAGAIEAVKEAVKGLGEVGEKLTFASRQSGATIGMLRALGEAGQRFGVTQESMNAGLAKFGAFMDQNARRAPDALNAWNQMPGAWQRIGKSLVGLGRDAQINKVLDFIPSVKYQDQKRKLLSILGLPEDWANLTKHEIEEVRRAGDEFDRAHPINLHNAEEIKKAWDNIASTLRGIKIDLGEVFAPNFIEGMKSLNAFLGDKSTISFIRGEFERIAQGIRDTAREVNSIIGFFHSANEFLHPRGNTKGRFSQGEDPMGKDYTATTPPINRWWNNLGKDTGVKEQLKSAITDGFLDALRQQNATGGYSPMAYHPGGGGRGGGGSFGSAAFPALNDDGSARGGGDAPAAPGGGGGAGGGGGGGSRGNRNNNRGNMKMGPLAQAFGATSSDGKGFAIFPDQASGDAAQHALINSKKYQGLTLDQFGNKYAEGSSDWKKTVGKQMGIGLHDVVKTNDPRLQGAIRKAEGTDGGMGGDPNNARAMDPMAARGQGITGAAKTAVRSSSGKTFQVASWAAPNFQRFIDNYEKAGGEIGPNSGTLGTRPGNKSYHPDARAMDLNQTARGIRGGGKTLPRDVEDKLADDAGLWPGSRFGDAGHFEARNKAHVLAKQREWAEQERHRTGADIRDHIRGNRKSQTDGTLLQNGKRSDAGGLNGSASLTIDLNGFPRGTRTAQSHDGLFKEVTLNRGRPMSSASETT